MKLLSESYWYRPTVRTSYLFTILLLILNSSTPIRSQSTQHLKTKINETNSSQKPISKETQEPIIIQFVPKEGKINKGKLLFKENQFGLEFENKAIELSTIHEIRLPIQTIQKKESDFLFPGYFAFHLFNANVIHGNLVTDQDDHYIIRSVWDQKLILPKQSIKRITHPLHRIPVIIEKFESQHWKNRFQVKQKGNSSSKEIKGFAISSDRDCLDWSGNKSITTGNIEIQFYDDPNIPMIPTTIKLLFLVRQKTIPITLSFSGTRSESYDSIVSIEYQDKKINSLPIPRKKGWHRLQVFWEKQKTIIQIDQFLLGVISRIENKNQPEERSREGMIGLQIRGIENKAYKDLKPFQINYLSIFRDSIPPLLVAARTQLKKDQLFYNDSAQWFGKIQKIDADQIVFSAKQKNFVVPWEKCIALEFATASENKKLVQKEMLTGEYVQLVLSVDYPIYDTIQGVIQQWDQNQITIQHPSLGRLQFPFSMVRKIRPIIYGSIIPLLTEPIRFQSFPSAKMASKKTKNINWQKTFTLDYQPHSGSFELELANNKSSIDNSLKIILNKQEIYSLTLEQDSKMGQIQNYTTRFAGNLLRKGDNSIEIVFSNKNTDEKIDCIINKFLLKAAKSRIQK